VSGRRAIFSGILIVALLAALLRVLHVPYKPERVLAAIPAEATFVSLHRDLASECPRLVDNSVFQALLSASGASTQEVSALASNRASRTWLHRLAKDTTAIAYVPSLGPSRAPAWVFSSWVGNQSQKLRWKVFWFHPSLIRRMAEEYGRTIYTVRLRMANPRQQLSVALVEGVVVGCLSEDPVAARYLVQTFDRQYGRKSVLTEPAIQAASLRPSPDRPHQAWFRMSHTPLPPRNVPALLACQASIPDRNRMAFEIALPGALPRTTASSRGTAPALLLGEASDLVLTLPTAWLRSLLLDSPSVPPWMESLQPLIDAPPSNSMAFAAILNRNHCGRIRGPLGDSLTPFLKGLRVPTVMMGFQVPDAQDAARRVGQCLDRLNSRHGLGLIPHPVPASEGTITLIEESRKNLYGRFEPDERVAWVFRDGWLIFASNASVLKQRIANALPSGSAIRQANAWQAMMDPQTGIDASVWCSTPATSRLLKDAISAVTISLLFRNPEGTQQVRHRLDTARSWAERVQGIGEVHVAIRQSGGWIKAGITATGTPTNRQERAGQGSELQ